MTDYTYANGGETRKATNAKYYLANKHKWVNVNKEDPSMPYLAPPAKTTEDKRVQQYSDWFTKHDGTPPPVFFSPEQIQLMAELHHEKMRRVAEASEVRNALYINALKHYATVGEEMPGDEKKWFGK